LAEITSHGCKNLLAIDRELALTRIRAAERILEMELHGSIE
jgi:hypothetical protein